MLLRKLTCSFQEYQENESALTVENVEINQTVNLYGCKSSTIVIKGKVNAVTLGTYSFIRLLTAQRSCMSLKSTA